jgi:hypothetical protein
MSALHRNALLDDSAPLLPVNSDDVLQLFQRIRREHPQYTDEMNMLVDILDGDLSFAFDAALAKFWNAEKSA